MTTFVKAGDTHTVAWRVNWDLTGATVRLLFRHLVTPAEPVIVAPATVTDAPGGVVTHALSGDLALGEYDVEVEIVKDGLKYSSPTTGFERLTVTPDLG